MDVIDIFVIFVAFLITLFFAESFFIMCVMIFGHNQQPVLNQPYTWKKVCPKGSWPEPIIAFQDLCFTSAATWGYLANTGKDGGH